MPFSNAEKISGEIFVCRLVCVLHIQDGADIFRHRNNATRKTQTENRQMTTLKINRERLETAAAEYLVSLDTLQCHVHLRIDAEGNAYVDTDTSYTVSHAEYNREPGAAKTVRHAQGSGQYSLDQDHEDYAADMADAVELLIDGIYEELGHEGYEVEEIATAIDGGK